ncbi:MAG: acyl-CoA dehydrogenase [Gammaproteobacteria bacterium]|jgi:acyl-CoA dehydrogenase|nr:acyl-CoA dehydrogenase [Gammaproteobacteria bacterium]MBT6245839.1 acyl-CoA dehydrogenase [Gammaproteobacteria bacterium]
MDFEISEEGKMIEDQIVRFLEDKIIPAEQTIATESQDTPNGEDTKTMKKLRDEAKGLGLWNLYLPDKEWGAGVSNLDYSLLCEHMGRSQIAPRVFNCQAPDTGNAEIIAEFGSTEQKAQFLQPLLSGEARSCFSMTEPDTSGADPTGLRTNAVKQGDDYIINGHKWFTSGAVGAHFAIAMVVTNPKGNPHQRTSMLLVPTNTPGFDLIRPVSVMGHTGGGGHCEIQYNDCRVPTTNLLGPEHGGFMIAQARLGPGRIHHCMRAIGMAERAFEIMCRHAIQRESHGSKLADKQFVQEWIASSRMEIDQARLLTQHTAWKMDKLGKQNTRQELSMTKVVVPNMMMTVLDRVIQCLGALGVSDDTPVASMWRNGRALRIADGPDEVHKMVIARRELKRFA